MSADDIDAIITKAEAETVRLRGVADNARRQLALFKIQSKINQARKLGVALEALPALGKPSEAAVVAPISIDTGAFNLGGVTPGETTSEEERIKAELQTELNALLAGGGAPSEETTTTATSVKSKTPPAEQPAQPPKEPILVGNLSASSVLPKTPQDDVIAYVAQRSGRTFEEVHNLYVSSVQNSDKNVTLDQFINYTISGIIPLPAGIAGTGAIPSTATSYAYQTPTGATPPRLPGPDWSYDGPYYTGSRQPDISLKSGDYFTPIVDQVPGGPPGFVQTIGWYRILAPVGFVQPVAGATSLPG